jgi:putative inorganic carbon (HCO3(-)) transporter
VGRTGAIAWRERGAGGGARVAATAGVIGVGAFGATLYALPQYLFPALEPLRVGAIAAALMYLGLLGRWVLGGEAPSAGGLRALALLALVALALLSPGWSLDPAASRAASAELVKLAAAYLAVTSLVDGPDRLRRVLWALALAAAVPAYHAVQNAVTGTDLLDGYRARWLGPFLDPNRLGMALVAAALLLVGLRPRARGPVAQLGVGLLLALLVAAILFTYSRGAALGLATGLLAYVVSGRGARTRSAVLVGAIAVALLALAPERFWQRTGTIAAYGGDASALARIHAWETAGHVLAARPLTGVGQGAFRAAWATYAPAEAGPRAYVAHNLFLEVAAELGIVALAAFVAFVGAGLRGAFRASARASPVREEGRAVFAALSGYLVCHLFAGHLLGFFLFLFLGLAAAAERIARRGPVPVGAPP